MVTLKSCWLLHFFLLECSFGGKRAEQVSDGVSLSLETKDDLGHLEFIIPGSSNLKGNFNDDGVVVMRHHEEVIATENAPRLARAFNPKHNEHLSKIFLVSH